MAQMSNRLDELKETHYRVTTGQYRITICSVVKRASGKNLFEKEPPKLIH